jgi:hypothetical protein
MYITSQTYKTHQLGYFQVLRTSDDGPNGGICTSPPELPLEYTSAIAVRRQANAG